MGQGDRLETIPLKGRSNKEYMDIFKTSIIHPLAMDCLHPCHMQNVLTRPSMAQKPHFYKICSEAGVLSSKSDVEANKA